MSKLEEKLKPQEIETIKEKTNDDFYFKNSNEFDDMFDEMKEYCEDNYVTIFDKSSCSFELMEFIKNNTKLFENMYKKNLLEEIEYKNSLENSNEYNNSNNDTSDDEKD